ncbi:phage tail sheath family protein [Negadavirga shengliensis]|uniref:Phage tail sheath family protein n=1 Tax=Negadavirga shengliensis TaxID=1389218 RepID=A0ABV9T5M3_9BACT
MANYKTPGVYIEEISKFPPSVAQVETAIPAFIGYTAKAEESVAGDLILRPKRIVSMLEYVQFYGEAQNEENIRVTIDETQDDDGNTVDLRVVGDFDGDRSTHLMFYSLQAFFANGGGPCYIVSVGTYGAFGADIDPGDASPPTLLYAGLAALEAEDEPTLIVFPESQGLATINDQGALHNAALAQCRKLQDRFLVANIYRHDSSSNILDVANDFRSDGVGTNSLNYGAVYAPNLETVFNYLYDPSDVEVVHNIIGGPNEGAGPAQGSMDALEGTNDALFARVKSAINQMPCIVPSAPVVAGIYAFVDNTRGVWKAPANVSVSNVIKPVLKITHDQQRDLNVDTTSGKSINVLRTFPGKGTLVWGARTLAGNDNEWRYVSVRRFFIMAEISIKKATEQFVFEPNDANTWTKVRAMIENFLLLQWRAGALAGAVPEDAFYVKVGLGATMTALDILEGRMNVEIGMAVVRPAEFIILKFSHKMQVS